MPKRTDIQSVLVIGSGPIVIGQAAEFDYAGAQACLALREEGIQVILVNNNPATVMTDEACADVVYFEPLTVASVKNIIERERPDGLLATLGGQTGLNLAMKLEEAGILEAYNVELLGTPMESIKKGEDREAFRQLMHELHEPVPESEIVHSVAEAVDFANTVGYPIIVRPAYTLGGAGGGIAESEEALIRIVKGGLELSPIQQCLIEKSIAGFKEIEYEVMRDSNDTCITVCNMENIDPVGVHTGDSIVVAPSQTLTDQEYQMLRSASLKIIRTLGIVGGCNIQFALDPDSKQYYLIEVNPRVSRSSALASKATGYPIARMAAKLSLGYGLHELKNPVTEDTYASFEPSLDYVVVKFPRWPFDKLVHVNRELGTQMKATGEVMAIERNLEAGLQKAVRSLEIKTHGLSLPSLSQWEDSELWVIVKKADDRRFFAILELLRRGVTIEAIHEQTKIDRFFLTSFAKLMTLEKEIAGQSLDDITSDELSTYKKYGFSDEWLASSWGVGLADVRHTRKALGVVPSYKMVDTCAAEFEAKTPYYYSSWTGENDLLLPEKAKERVLIIGSGPIRIGQGIEFDYCSVHGAKSLRARNFEAIIINNNPETVSTDYETADRLYFEPLAVEDVLNVIEVENVDHVIVQLGGQTAIGLTKGLEEAGVSILGTTQDVIDQLEDRERFYEFMRSVEVPHIPGKTAETKEELLKAAQSIGYPILLRPSYVIGGQGMFIASNQEELAAFCEDKNHSVTFPILVDAYYPGVEFEVDVLTDGSDIFIPGMFEHVEKAGVHSGDSMAVTPPPTLEAKWKQQAINYTRQIAKGMAYKGLFNIQFVLYDEELYVIEVNPRASRTVPIFSKATSLPLITYTIDVLFGKTIAELGLSAGYRKESPYYTVKAPVFSYQKLAGLDPLLEAEMKSTGELIAISKDLPSAFRKAFAWGEEQTPALFRKKGSVFCQVDRAYDTEWQPLLRQLKEKGYSVVTEEAMSFSEWLASEDAICLVSVPAPGQKTGKQNREEALKQRVTVVSDLATFEKMIECLEVKDGEPFLLPDVVMN
ncbi:carbamoyl phosphate synthase large subunit [Halalkalibacterium halodurans]|uniref:Carbamoyl phosphate synthase arginine-specific large chain n=1 Tax=Halalkalibacterium halodurans (strain ATCC BAA-125 / DSM 18197 / FERM 7344 / JCM 9153 / C-125) TaxID=272558 RepID=CARY_HALH5|nr:carbamoyl phosphate synthase large subunit [Halalkalibacterium halodurans]Q9K8V7.1 RecName: Full=Carbamoyl phosphate synthase arginine-specific large chain; AltName: Full=Carbamoyl phosphate synthetase ammonia chain [Halalkalibacterium halodurans C-125]MED4174699.1 carbamoyl phosphate synthase large subunit [Halalkalibacterium halodurans]BAB06614.1 arginine specific carbamoyl-phosphate synthase large chain [Halalkalibacterium halodurans C-125]